MKSINKDPWYRRLARSLGLNPDKEKDISEARNYGKHKRGHQKPRNFDAKRKIHRQMAKASRRINRKR